jgi:predicted DNA-binding transcriptional regulator AlpA
VSAAENNPTPLSLLPLKEVKARVGLSTATVYRLMQRGTFPRPRKVGTKSLWRSDEIEAWILAQTCEPGDQQDIAA